jgi:hypothetical protein
VYTFDQEKGRYAPEVSDMKSEMTARVVIVAIAVLTFGAMAQPATAQTVQDVRIRWDAYAGAPGPLVSPGTYPATNLFTLLERRQIAGELKPRRDRQPSADQIVVTALDVQGQEIDRYLIPDPRLLRSEAPGPTGELSGVLLHRAYTEIRLVIADDPAIAELRFLQPRWTGTQFVFDLLGSVQLP